MRASSAAVAGATSIFLLLGCSGWFGEADPPPREIRELSDLEGTKFEASAPPIATFGFDVGTRSVGPFGQPDGLILTQAFPGEGVGDPVQVVAVFAEPMVPLGDIDSMAQSVPVSCSPAAGLTPRWAGTTTAILVAPREGLPAATKFTCTVPKSTRAVSGKRLGVDAKWSFETPRLRMSLLSPNGGATLVDPADPLILRFDQDIPPDRARQLVRVTADGRDLESRVSQGANPREIEIRADLPKDAAVTVSMPAGALGVEGHLPTTADQAYSFRTYPPLSVVEGEPVGTTKDASAYLSLRFTTRVSGAQVAEHLTIDPKPHGWEPPDASWAWTGWSYGIGLEPRTKYTATLSAGVTDEFGQALDRPFSWSFVTGDAAPRWKVPGDGVVIYAANNPREVPFHHTNLTDLSVRVGTVKNEDVGWPYVDHHPNGAPWRVPITAARNATQSDVFSLTPHLSDDGFGWVAAMFETTNFRDDHRVVDRGSVLVVTDLGATVKIEPGATEVFVTSLATGEPVADVEVSLRETVQGPDRTRRPGPEQVVGVTDANGWLRYEGRPGVSAEMPDDFAVLLRKGNDRSIVFQSWYPNYAYFGNDGDEIRSHSFVDRGLYRLGDPLHGHVSFRSAHAGGLSAVKGKVNWTLSDANGTEVAKGEGDLTGAGTFDLSTELPAVGPLGDWSLTFSGSGADWSSQADTSVAVKAYRPAAFRVTTHGPAGAVAGGEVTVTADARYLFGAAMSDADLVFRAYARPRSFRPDGWQAYDFGKEHPWWTADEVEPPSPVLADGRPVLADGAASHTIALTDPRWADEPFVLSVEAVVTDVDRQTIASTHTLTVLPAAYGVGLKPDRWVATAGDAAKFEIVAVTAEGKPVADRPVELSVVRREFDTVRERALDGRWRYVTTPRDTPVTDGSVRSTASPVAFSFKPRDGGLHVLIARSTDDAGKVTVSEASVYVVGAGASWAREEGRAWLVADKKEYAAGDTARVVVAGHVPGSWALVTVEREGVLWRETRKLEGASPVLEVALKPEWVPGVRLSVTAATGAGPQDSPDDGRPEIVFGTIDLHIDASDRHLAVDVTAPSTSLRPRDPVEVSIAVTRAGKPAKGAVVTLYAVDEGVLTLTGYETPDAFEQMYADHQRNVVTMDNRMAILDRARYLTKGASPGGGGGEMDPGAGSGPELRSRFLTTVTFQSLVTGKDGVAKGHFELPDNLTEFRVMAVAEQEDAFGADEEAIRVSRPLVLRPALPRVLREGDDAFAGVVVHNYTDADHVVTVEASADGPIELTGSPATVKVAAGAALEVPFHLKGLEAGATKITFRGAMGDERDAVEVPLRVQSDVPLESVGTAALVTGKWTEQLALPDGARPGHGGLSVSLGTTALTGVDEALGYLTEYPYGCVEQITSRGTGALALLSVRERSGSAIPEADLKAVVEVVLDRLKRHERGSGGYSYWSGAFEPASLYGTRHVLEFLALAKAAGFAVDSRGLDRTVQYLRNFDDTWEYRRSNAAQQRAWRTEVALALAAAGKPDAGLLGKVYDDRESLSLQHRAELLAAMVDASPRDSRVDVLARSLVAKVYVEAESASLRDEHASRGWGSDDRTTAAALLAFTRLPNQPLTPKFAMHLAKSRRAGRWHDTRATAAVLRALAAYAEKFEAPVGSEIQAALTLQGQELVRESLATPEAHALTVPMADLKSGPLVVTGDRLYFATRLTYAPLVAKPRDEGFWVDRRLEIVDGGVDGHLTAGATVAVTLTVATPVQRFDVAVRDPFPAGLEAVDTSLATASRRDSEYEDGDGDSGDPDEEEWDSAWDGYGGPSFDHTEVDDGEVRLFAESLSPGVHTFRYVLRATTPGRYAHPPARAEEMYEPENFGNTAGSTVVIAPAP